LDHLVITDSETNAVFVADTLRPRFPRLYRGLNAILSAHGIPLREISGTRDVWCRDYLPVQVALDRFVQFRYAPNYLTGKYRHLRADGEIGLTLPWLSKCTRSEIVLDGGNVVRGRDMVIMTDKVLSANRQYETSKLLAELERLFDVARVVLIPVEPGDVTGHADGVIRLTDAATVLINDYRQVDENYRNKLLRSLNCTGLNVVEIPYVPASGLSDGMPSAVGNYINFLHAGSLVVVPSYGMDSDEVALRMLAQHIAHANVKQLHCPELAKHGGALHCCTWTMGPLRAASARFCYSGGAVP
jgi:agmatine/peptidylarginine deiminase